MRARYLVLIGLVASCAAGPAPRVDWVALPGGCFAMGEDHAYPEERPVHETCVAPFLMTPTEVTNAQFRRFVQDTGYVTSAERVTAHDKLPAGSAVFKPARVVAGESDFWQFTEGANWRRPDGPAGPEGDPQAPVVHVTQEDALAFALWAGGRLPTEAEWEFAARPLHVDSRSSTEPKGNVWQGMFPITNTAEDGYRGLAPVGSYPANDWGLFDMIGNVWEWTQTPYAPSHAERDRRLAGPDGLDFHQPGVPVATIKGGSFLCSANYCRRYRASSRQAQDLSVSTSHIGFRIVRDP